MIIPQPAGVRRMPGRLALAPSIRLDAGPGAVPAAELLAHHLGPGRPRSREGTPLRLALRPGGPPESYRLVVAPGGLDLTAPALAGLLHGVHTLRLLMDEDGSGWPCVEIDDAPVMPRRGVLLDVARHFMPLDFLRSFIDELALHKLNVLHLHLTDDQGWRIEIGARPRLTEIGAWRTEPDGSVHGGHYTRKDLVALVEYAASRGVEIVPEIDMPGHVRAALAAYPGLGNDPRGGVTVWNGWGVSEDVLAPHDGSLEFLRDVLTEVAEVFPSPIVHIGGDECPTVQWERSPAAVLRAREAGLDDPRLLRSWFVARMHEHLTRLGRRTAVWDDGSRLPGGRLPSDALLTVWLDAAHAATAVARGHQVVMAPHTATYFDYRQGDGPDETPAPGHPVTTLADAYAFEPLAGGLPAADIRRPEQAGVVAVQAQLWTEYAPTPDHVRYLAYPRLCAFAEAAWCAERPGFAAFRSRLPGHLGVLRSLGALAGPGPRWERPADAAERMKR
ncbi:beta-N-acetylhexosaminidase [Streptomyces montanisoli]|nr:beta-N-acetylhexosaminidase [Streptomyces montanisoli]